MNNTLLAVLALPLLALGGCTSTYAIDLRNQSSQPVFAELLARGPEGGLALVGQPVRLGPGDRGGIGPVAVDARRSVVLRADSQGNGGRPAMLDVTPGTTVAIVGQDGTTANSPITLRSAQN